METFSALLALCVGNSPVTGEFPAQRSVTRSFAIFLDLHLNKRLSKQSWCWWFETPSRSLWRHCNATRYLQLHFLAHYLYLDFNSLKFITKLEGAIHKKSVLVQVIAWRIASMKPSPESMITGESTSPTLKLLTLEVPRDFVRCILIHLQWRRIIAQTVEITGM